VHIFNHALAKGSLFLALAAMAASCASLRLEDLAGIGRRMPWTFAAFVVSGLSLIGIPGTAGFISKWYLISAAIEQGTLGVALVVVILVSSLMAVYYVWRIVEVAAFGETPADAPQGSPAPALVAALWVAAVANLVFGLAPALPLSLAGEASTALLEHLR
jgi:multicomponent Na+:H+ antiporter subunit D